ncbi:LCP family protein [Gracilibacillus phocaeensis]|uniref:LCP family protein n=1 Tax=Gracilibacillus phocaeensis TaxID=2042304 RepID=UPI00102F9E73|nr:LCP family protein [Gracilibacillus phocaeensis]
MLTIRSRLEKKQKSKKKRIILYSLLFIVLVLLAGVAYIVKQSADAFDSSYHELERPDDKSPFREEGVTISDDPISVLLLGLEDYATNGEGGRTDTMILVTLNPKTEQLTTTLIPRDTRVDYTAEEAGSYAGTHKINGAYNYGSLSGYGATELTVSKVEEFLDVPIDEYVTVNFTGFRDIVDVLGGVEIDVKEGFWEDNIFNNERIDFTEGVQELDGEEALAFVRMRKREVNNIYSREERQVQFIQASMKEILSASTLFKANEISDVIGENVMTSLNATEIYNLQRAYSDMDSSKIEKLNVAGEDQQVDGVWYFTPDEQQLVETIDEIKANLEI